MGRPPPVRENQCTLSADLHYVSHNYYNYDYTLVDFCGGKAHKGIADLAGGVLNDKETIEAIATGSRNELELPISAYWSFPRGGYSFSANSHAAR
jgi:hypothetical protein